MTPERPAGVGASPNSTHGAAPVAVARKSAKAPRHPKPRQPQLYAALDLGTNSCRMLIARPHGGHFEVVDSFSKAVELGTGLKSSGLLSYHPMQRTLQALRICRAKLERHKVSRMRLVATEACRRARNSRDFIRRAHAETGLRLDIITAEEEARLAVVSCASLVAMETEQLLVIDIGGGQQNWSGLICRAWPLKSGAMPSWACIVARSTATLLPVNRKSLTGSACRWALPH